MSNDLQKHFNETYITAGEIATVVGVSRTSVHHARRKGVLPEPIKVGDNLVFVWVRDAVAPHVREWKASILNREGVTL